MPRPKGFEPYCLIWVVTTTLTEPSGCSRGLVWAGSTIDEALNQYNGWKDMENFQPPQQHTSNTFLVGPYKWKNKKADILIKLNRIGIGDTF